jgi:hypothetical protein
MVELTLPKNSQISPGKSWLRPASKNIREFRVCLWSLDDGKTCALTRAMPSWTMAVSRAPQLAG